MNNAEILNELDQEIASLYFILQMLDGEKFSKKEIKEESQKRVLKIFDWIYNLWLE